MAVCMYFVYKAILIVLGVKEASLMDIGSSSSQSDNASSSVEGKATYGNTIHNIPEPLTLF